MPTRLLLTRHLAAALLATLAAAAPLTGQSTLQADPAPARRGAPPPDSSRPAAPPSAQRPGSTRAVDRARDYAEHSDLAGRLFGEADGFYIRFGGLVPGSGLAAGPAYRTHVLGDRVLVDLSSTISTRLYKAVEANVRWWQGWGRRAEFWTDVRYQDYPQEDYYGLGQQAPLSARADYALDSTWLGARGQLRLRPWLQTGASLGLFSPSPGPGTDDRYPPAAERFGDAAPGLDVDARFVHTSVFVQADTRDRPGSPTRGGWYRATLTHWDDVRLDAFDFNRLDLDAAHHLQLAPRHVVAGHVGMSHALAGEDRRVPVYLLPALGGGDLLRSYRDFRFRDEHLLVLNAEYRWQAAAPVDLALFVDAGEVQGSWSELGLADLRTSYGIGLRVHSDTRTFMRLDLGFGGGEGARLWLKIGPSF